mmetsp:Transcript_23391/g.35458  ORF Transcript_23391/g.35458 Transcript_23391/m.35458 type:complete len:132 (+) Transcript_23391:3856-4251(+)
MVHVSGITMIAQGTDGISPGDHSQGVMAGHSFDKFIPLHLNAIKVWFHRLSLGLNFKFVEPDDWYETTHSFGNFVWNPPPAAAEVVVEQLVKARLKRPESMHGADTCREARILFLKSARKFGMKRNSSSLY